MFRYQWPGYDIVEEFHDDEGGLVIVVQPSCRQCAMWWSDSSGSDDIVRPVLTRSTVDALVELGAERSNITTVEGRHYEAMLIQSDTFSSGDFMRMSSWTCGKPGLYFSILTSATTLSSLSACHAEALRSVECYEEYDG